MKQLFKKELKERRILTTAAVEAAIEKKDYTKLANLVELADEFGIKKSLRHRAWTILGTRWKTEQHFPEAVIAFSSARRIDTLHLKTVKLLIESLQAFVEQYKTVFSISDIDKIDQELERILEYYKVNKLWTNPVIKDGWSLLETVRAIRTTAKEATETPATHKTDRIVDALHKNVTMEEVRADFARLITPYLLERIAEEEKKVPKKKKPTKKKPNTDIEKKKKK